MKIRKIFKVETAHRVLGAYTKRCQGIHGHSYKIEVFIKNNSLDETGMVIDFKKLKEQLNSFIDAFDHSLIISDIDKPLLEANRKYELNNRYMVVPYNPTAENMAKHIFQYIDDILRLNVCKVIVHETDTGCAICEVNARDIDLNRVIYSEVLVYEGCCG